jgi:4'-phosphopantetheinyl transferase
MAHQPLTVYDWSVSANKLKLDNDLLVIALRTAPNMPRAEARLQIRAALKEALARLLTCSAADIDLLAQPGQALRLLQPKQNIGLSISHEVGISLAAIHMNGAVGIDLMKLSNTPTSKEIHTLATDYLGSKIAQQLAGLTATQQAKGFSKAWTALEASLKCSGEQLIEWNEPIEKRLAQYTCRDLILPDGYIGTVAF